MSAEKNHGDSPRSADHDDVDLGAVDVAETSISDMHDLAASPERAPADPSAAAGMVHLPHRKKYRVALTYGTFDLFHVGHTRLLQRISELADRVIVGCSTDEFNAGKGKSCVIPYEDRVEVLRSCRFVSQVIPEETWEQKVDDIRRYGAEVFAMGLDWAGKFDELDQYCDVVYLPRTDGISTTHLKTIMQDWEKRNTGSSS